MRPPPPKLPSAYAGSDYSASPDGVDANLLILLHGLGDCARNFARLGATLRLPQTAVLSLNAPRQVPLLEADHRAWFDSFDLLTGDLLRDPDPSEAIASLRELLDRLVDQGWPRAGLHLLGFGQGGSLALQALVAWRCPPLGSVVSVCGPPLSAPASRPPESEATATMLVTRHDGGDQPARAWQAAASASLRFVTLPRTPTSEPCMPRSAAEWQPILRSAQSLPMPSRTDLGRRFWSERLRSRPGFGAASGELIELQ